MSSEPIIDPPVSESPQPQIAVERVSPRRLALLAAAGLFMVFAASVLYAPADADADGQYFTICVFKTFTGLPCPGCGLTHSFCALGKGHLMSAFSYNLLGPPLFFFFVLIWIRAVCVLGNRNGFVLKFDRLTQRFRIVRGFAIAFVLFGIG